MSKTREASLWQWLSKAREPYGERLDIERIENSIGSGHPDVRLMVEGKHAYIELKTVARPARKTTGILVGLRKEQVDWAGRYNTAGGKSCYLLVQVGSGHAAERYLIDSYHFPFLFENRVDEGWLAEHSYTTKEDGPAVVCTIAAETG